MIKVRKEQMFGFTIMALIILPVLVFTPWTALQNGHIGLIMLAMVVVAIMLGFPTAFTLMGMGVTAELWRKLRSEGADSARCGRRGFTYTR